MQNNMSFRHTYITEFLYKHGLDKELKDIEETLAKYGTVAWKGGNNIGHEQLGYFHGVFKDLNGHDMEKGGEGESIIKELASKGVKIAIVYE